MPHIERSALVNHSAQQMFDLVNDVASYPNYMSGCNAARVIKEDESCLVGELTLGKAGIEFTFTTRNRLQPPVRIDMELESGKFKEFEASWQFQSLGDNACKVSLTMDFEFDSGLVGFAAEKLFASVANAQVDALVNRANDLYG
ncbi:MAG: type II toxin-antitoxin system RatA family toxin [Proteobacteria bacterium]|nr:type II toxin-antitoxin system RatA family toxin [Pseudomonadota bacterium]